MVKAYPILTLAQFFLDSLYLEQVLKTEYMYMLSIIDQPIIKLIVVCYKQLLPSQHANNPKIREGQILIALSIFI